MPDLPVEETGELGELSMAFGLELVSHLKTCWATKYFLVLLRVTCWISSLLVDHLPVLHC